MWTGRGRVQRGSFMVEEGGTPEVHIDPHAGGWGVKKGSPKKMKLQSKTFY